MKNHMFCEYTYFHRVAFKLLVEKYFEGEERIEMLKRAEIHDLDKLLLYQFKEKDEVKEYHRKNSLRKDFLLLSVVPFHLAGLPSFGKTIQTNTFRRCF